MAYLDVITLVQAKNYLKIDDGLTDDDALIETMIKAAFRYIEKRTNHLVYARDIVYNGACQVKVYDYPINAVIAPLNAFKVDYSMFTCYANDKQVELNVGYLTPDLVPEDIIVSAYEMLSVWYYNSEKQVNSTLIPESVNEVLDLYKRFL